MQVYFVSGCSPDPLVITLRHCLKFFSSSSVFIDSIHQQLSIAEKLKKIIDADVVVCEMSLPSVEVGVSMGLAYQLHKPLLVCNRTESSPTNLITTNSMVSESMIAITYSEKTAYKELRWSFDYLASLIESRFNFRLPQRLRGYLLWAAKNYQLPQAVYLRRLIERDLNKNPDYYPQLRNRV